MAVKDGLGPRPVAQSAKRYNNCQLPTANLPALSCSWLLCCTAPVKGPPRRAQTPWQWRTERARGRQPRLETSFKPCFYLPSYSANCHLACVVWQLAFVLHGSGQGTPSQGSNTMAVKDGAGPRPVAQSAKRYSLNRQETEVQTVTSKDPVAGLKHATAAVQAGVQGPCRMLKHHGSEGRACVVLQLAFVLHGSGQGTPSQGSNTMAVKDGAGPRPVAQSAKRYCLNRETEVQTVTSKDPVAGLKHATAAVQAGVQGPCRRAKTPWQWRTGLRCLAAGFCAARLRSRDPLAGLKHHGSEGRSGPAARSPECQTLLSEPTRNWGPNRDFTRDSCGPSWSPRTLSQG